MGRRSIQSCVVGLAAHDDGDVPRGDGLEVGLCVISRARNCGGLERENRTSKGGSTNACRPLAAGK